MLWHKTISCPGDCHRKHEVVGLKLQILPLFNLHCHQHVSNRHVQKLICIKDNLKMKKVMLSTKLTLSRLYFLDHQTQNDHKLTLPILPPSEENYIILSATRYKTQDTYQKIC